MIDVNPSPKGKRSGTTSAIVNGLIDEALLRRRAREPERRYVGMSQLGDECTRRVYYEVTKAPRKAFSGTQLRAFEMGHLYEDRMAEWLKEAGFELLTRDPETGQQFRLSQVNGRISGGIDGGINTGPIIPNLRYPCLWENKALMGKYWREMVKNGVEGATPKYYGQINILMGYFGFLDCMFTSENKDNGDIYTEIIPYNHASAQAASDRGVRVIQAIDIQSEPGRMCSNREFYEAKMCGFIDYCFRDAAEPARRRTK